MKQNKTNFFRLFSFPKLMLWLLTVVVVFGQLQKIAIGNGVTIFVHEMVMTAAVVISILLRKEFRESLREFFYHRSKLEWFFIIWVGFGLGLAGLMGQNILLVVLYLARLLLYILFGRWLWWGVSAQYLSRIELAFAWLFWLVMFLFFGVLQYFFIPDTQFLFFLGWDDHYYRLVSTLLDPGFTGILYVLGWCSVELFWEVFPQFKQQQALKYLILAGLMFSLLLTYSRASYLAFATVLGIVGVSIVVNKSERKEKLQVLVLLALLFVAAIPFLPRPHGDGVRLERTTSANARVEAVQRDFAEIQGIEWITGQGLFVSEQLNLTQPNEYLVVSHARISDNWIMMLLKGTGIVGLLVFITKLLDLWRQWGKHSVWLVAALGAVLVHGLFNASVVYPFVWLFLSGMVVIAVRPIRSN